MHRADAKDVCPQVMEAQYAQGLLHPTISSAHPQGETCVLLSVCFDARRSSNDKHISSSQHRT
jgi:hypothetical protein